jgi:hypothetical protein
MPKTKRKAKTKTLTRKPTFVRGRHLVIDKAGAPARTANVVQRAVLNPVDPNDPDAPTVRAHKDKVFFKPHADMAPSQYAVASTRLARFLGMPRVIAHNAFAKIKNVRGVVSGAVAGEPLLTVNRDKEYVIPEGTTMKEMADIAKASQLVERDGKYYDISSMVYQWVNFQDPRIQKGLSDLQLFDAISGQQDRHAGNIFINPETGEVSGIDDDLSFGRGTPVADQAEARGKYVGLPALVDQKTAERILALDPTNLPEKLYKRVTDSEALTQKEIEDAVLRFDGVRQYLRRLQKEGKLVGQNETSWGDATYQQALQDPTSSYLKRQAADLEDALQRSAANDPMYEVVGAPQLQPPPPTAATLPQPPLVMPPLPRPPWQRPTVPVRVPPITLPQLSTSLGPESPRTGEPSPSRATAARLLAAARSPRPVLPIPSAVDVDDSGDSSEDSTTQ